MQSNESSYRSIFKSTFLFGFVQVFNIVMKAAINKAVAILLGTEGMGVIRRRIAFGRVNDAVRLAFADDITPAMIERADLFAVAEIKRDRGGKVEMKFFDRQKALEKLIDCEREESGAAGAENLISAIYGNVSGNGKGEEL